MPPTTLALRSKIPTLKSRTGPLLNRAPPSTTVEEPLNSGSLSKKRGSATVAPPTNPRASPNPRARKILRTNAALEQPKRPRASSPPPPSSARKRPRKSNHPPDFDYVPQANVTPPPRRITRHSLAAEEDVEGEDPMDCLTGPGALDTSGDSPPPPEPRARSATGFDFTLNGSRLMDGLNEDISSGGLYSDLDDDENEHAETSVARLAGIDKTRVTPVSKPRPSIASTSRQPSTTPRRVSQSSNTSRRQSKSPNISRRTSTATTRQTSATPRRQSTASTSRRQSTTPTPRRRTEPKMLPPPILELTAAQARKEARLAAAQAEAEAKLRASLDEDVGGLSVVGEEEEEEGGEEEEELAEDEGEREEAIPEEPEDGRDGSGNEAEEEQEQQDEEGPNEGEDSDDPLASAPVFRSPSQPSHVDVSRTTTTPRGKNTPGNRIRKAATPGNKSKELTPRRQSAATNHVRWTPRSSGKRSTRAESRDEDEDENESANETNDVSQVSSRTRASLASSRRSSAANTPRSASGSKSVMSQVEEEEEEEAGSTPRGRNSIVLRSASRGRSSTSARSRSASRTRLGSDSRRQSQGSPVGRGRQSTASSTSRRNASKSASRERNSSTVSRRDSGNRTGSTMKSPMRLEVVLPTRRRSSLGNKSQRPVIPEQDSSRVVTQQPTPDPSSLDHSPGLVARLNQFSDEGSSRDPTYQPSSEPESRVRDDLGRFAPRDPENISRSHKSAVLNQTQRDSSVSLGTFHYEEPQRRRRSSGSKKSKLSETTRQADSTRADETFGGPLGEIENNQSPDNAYTPRVAFDSTARSAFDFTPGSELRSGFGRFGSYAQSTPYVRGSFGRLNQGGESSPIPTGPSDLELDGNSSDALHDRIPYTAKGKARDDDPQTDIVPESSQPSYREVSVDSSIAIAMSSPDQSLRTERVSTPRITRVSLVGVSDDDQEEGSPSPSAGRQSFGESINGRSLSDILNLRKQTRVSLTTRLDDTAQEVLYNSSAARSGRGNSWPEALAFGTTAASTGSNDVSKSLETPQIEDISSDDEIEPRPAADEEDEGSVHGSVPEDYPLDKHSIHIPHSDGLGGDDVQDYDASVHFDGPSRAPIRRSATPILRGRHQADSDDDRDQSVGTGLVQRSRSTSGEDDSSGPDDNPEEQDFEELEDDQDDQPLVTITGSASSIRQARDALTQAGYTEDDQSKIRYAPSPSSSARSTSRSLSRPRDRYGSVLDRSQFAGDRTTGLSRSQMMVEASMYEDWEPPARSKLKPRPWTDHDWRMLAHYLRRVQKSQALAKGLSSREELDLMMVNVHAVVDRFVEEEAHGIKLEGEWARPEITGRAVYLIIKERHKQDGTWKRQALNDPSFSAILADMTRPRGTSEGLDEAEDLSGEIVLPTALAKLPAPSRAAAAQLLARTPAGDESGGHVSETPFDDEDDEDEDDEEVPVRSIEISQTRVSRTERSSPKRSPKRRNAPVIVAHQRTQALRDMHNPPNLTTSDYSSFQVDQTDSSTASTTMYSRLIGSLSSIIGGRSHAETTETSVAFRKLKPVSRNPIDLTHDDDDEQPSFPILNHVPTPARPTPARPRRQKHVEPKLNLPPLQHISPPRPIELPRVPRKKPMRRVASVRELAMSFEKIGEENRKAAEAARGRVGYGRSVSGPVASTRVAAPDFARPVAKGPSPKKTRQLKDEIEVLEVSDSSVAVRESVDL